MREKKISKAKLHLMTHRNTTFFSALIANLKIEFSEDIPTAGTDGIRMIFNPKFLESLTIDETIGLMLHEAYHSVYQHMDRQITHDLNKQIWNYAGDYVINGDLDNRNYTLPKGALIEHKYDKKGTKEVYDILMQDPPPIQPDLLDLIFGVPDGMDELEHRERVMSNVVKAVTQAKISNDYGSVPGHVKRIVEEMLDPKLPWNTILQNHMSAYANEEYSWSRPNKRFWPNYYLPSMKSEALNQITVAIDVSGSVSQKDLNEFMAEVRYIWDTLKPKKMRIVGFDTQIHDDLEFYEGDMLEDVQLKGGGGTHVSDVLNLVRDDEPELTLIFSDGYFSKPYMDDVISDVFWIIKDNEKFTAPKGEIIHYES